MKPGLAWRSIRVANGTSDRLAQRKDAAATDTTRYGPHRTINFREGRDTGRRLQGEL